LVSGSLDIWSAPLDLSAALVDDFFATLSADERQRAARFGTEQLRSRFIAGRGRLRAILAQYLEAVPAEIQFEYEGRGKPALAKPWKSRGLHFNLSHSHGWALLAVADREVGADVEQLRPMQNMERLVERYFGDAEIAQWRQLPQDARPLGFFHGWTRKEAWLKAVGSGLSFPLDQVQVSLAPDRPARFLSIRHDLHEASQWWLDSFTPAAGYVAAVAMRGKPTNVRFWTLE
jgi:4'-phosphopantetheinyl transferase